MTARSGWVVALLAVLAVLGVLWWLLVGRLAPVFASIAYLAVMLLVLRGREHRAAMLIGFAGFMLHLAEAVTGALGELGGFERALFVANLGLPLVVSVLAWLESRSDRPKREDHGRGDIHA